METPVSNFIENKVKTEQIDDNLLAGLYASGIFDLESINYEIFNLIVKKNKVFTKIDLSDESKFKTIVISSIQSILFDEKSKILIINNDEEEINSYLFLFKTILSYFDNIKYSKISNYDYSDSIIIANSNQLDDLKKINNIDYIIIDNCIDKNISNCKNLWKINKMILVKEVNSEIMFLVGKISKEIDYSSKKAVTNLEESENKEVDVEEDLSEKVVVEESENKEVIVEEDLSQKVVVQESENKEVVVEEDLGKKDVVEDLSEKVVVEESENKEVIVEEDLGKKDVVEDLGKKDVVEDLSQKVVVEESENKEVIVEEDLSEKVVVEESKNKEVIVEEDLSEKVIVEKSENKEVIVEEDLSEKIDDKDLNVNINLLKKEINDDIMKQIVEIRHKDDNIVENILEKIYENKNTSENKIETGIIKSKRDKIRSKNNKLLKRLI